MWDGIVGGAINLVNNTDELGRCIPWGPARDDYVFWRYGAVWDGDGRIMRRKAADVENWELKSAGRLKRLCSYCCGSLHLVGATELRIF